MNALANRRRFLSLALGAGAVPAWAAQRLQWRERILLGFGTTLWLRAGHEDAARADSGLHAAVAALREVEQQMSLFDAQSALCRLNRDGVLEQPPAALLDVLRFARGIAVRSSGAFDVTVQPLMQVWQNAGHEGRAPGRAELRDARARVGWRGVELGAAQIVLHKPGMALTLNGIAQGYAADRARAALQGHGVAHALIDTGEWSAWGDAPGATPWALGIENPRAPAGVAALLARVQLRGRAVATSSDAHTTYSADHRDHHIIDPRSARSPRELASVTVAASSGMLADALTKVLFMAGWDGALPLARRWGVDALIVDKAGRWRASAGLAMTRIG